MLVIPIEADVPFDKKPFLNWLIVVVNIVVFCITAKLVYDESSSELLEPYLLQGWKWPGIVTHMWLHGGIMHLVGNMIFLLVFGNAVCYKLGNLFYFPAYMFVGACSTLAYILFTGDHPALGASGAINGIVGMYVVLFPANNISLFYWILIFFGIYRTEGYWIILLWFAFDILGLVMGGGGVAYMAHIGGFVGGVVLAYVLLHFDIIRMEPRFELSLIDILRGKHIEEAREFENMYNRSSMDFINEQTEQDQPLHEPIDISSSQAPAVRQPVEDILSDEDFLGSNTAGLGLAPEPPAMVGPDDVIADVVPPAYSSTSDVQPHRIQKPKFVRFFCECGQKVKIPAKYAGKTGKCPKCQKRIQIPQS